MSDEYYGTSRVKETYERLEDLKRMKELQDKFYG